MLNLTESLVVFHRVAFSTSLSIMLLPVSQLCALCPAEFQVFLFMLCSAYILIALVGLDGKI